MDRRTVVVVVALSLLLVAAQGEGEIPTFDVWLEAASGPLASAIVGVVLSWVIEFVPAYESLAPWYKRLGYFGLCMVVPVAAACLRAALGIWRGRSIRWCGTRCGTGRRREEEDVVSRTMPASCRRSVPMPARCGRSQGRFRVYLSPV
jgi:hypothetical protein